MDVLTLLKQDHKTVAQMIDSVQQCEPGEEQLTQLATQISQALTVHASIEEKFFYPELRDRAEDDDERVDVFEAFTEHDVVKHLIGLLKSGRKQPEEFKAELQVLGESVKHHVKEEESTLFALAREVMDEQELEDLGERMEAAKQRLMAGASAQSGNGRRKSAVRKSTARKGTRKKAPATTRKAARKSSGRRTTREKRR